MKTSRTRTRAGRLAALLGALSLAAHASDGTVNLKPSTNSVVLKVDGDKDNDWWIETSTNLTTWITATNLGTLLSGNETNAPWRTVGTATTSATFYRARQTAGLYDPAVFHSF